jgi:hypothetical protein
MNNQELNERSTIRPIPPGDASSFIIHDNSLQIANFMPEKYIEPLVIIAKIERFDRIDNYMILCSFYKIKNYSIS